MSVEHRRISNELHGINCSCGLAHPIIVVIGSNGREEQMLTNFVCCFCGQIHPVLSGTNHVCYPLTGVDKTHDEAWLARETTCGTLNEPVILGRRFSVDNG